MEPFKSEISPDLVSLTGRLLAREIPGVHAEEFAARIIPKLDDLELKQRVRLVADALHQSLPEDIEKRRSVLLAMLHPDDLNRSNSTSTEDGLCGWGIWPLTEVIGQHGLGSLSLALETLREMTKRGTSEFDVRPFIARSPEQALEIITSWTDDPNYHVRRLVSEGTRPRLPWGMRLHALIDNPQPMLPALTRLRDDPSEYVRRSVANHLNDISKDHPDLISDLAQDWLEDANANRTNLVRHACRSLIKQGHPGALAAFGYQTPEIAKPSIKLANDLVLFGDALSFDVELRSTSRSQQHLLIDYVVYHQKSDGTLTPKVFKWTKVDLEAGQIRKLSRRHPMKPITTRRYYPGRHAVSLRINGVDFCGADFQLKI